MSADHFSFSGEKRRVAHRVKASSKQIMEEFAFKRRSVGELAKKIGTEKSEKNANKSRLDPNGKDPLSIKPLIRPRKKCRIEDEDFVVDDYDDYNSDCEEESDGKSTVGTEEEDELSGSAVDRSEESLSCSSVPGDVSPASDSSKRGGSISESDGSINALRERPESKWLCKPRIHMRNDRRIISERDESLLKRVKRRAVLSTSSEDDGDAKNNLLERHDSSSFVIRNVKRKRKESSESDEISSGGNASLEVDDDMSRDSGDSEAEGSRLHRHAVERSILRKRCLQFFNNSPREDIIRAPRMTEKVADFILENRPFASCDILETQLSSCPRGSRIVECYVDYLENRGILERILDDCKSNSEQMQQAIETLKGEQMPSQPKLLNPKLRLHPYQQVGLNWLVMMYKLDLNAILGDEMGLGKTIQIIAFLTYLKEKSVRGPHLIVVPSSTIENWLNEFELWSPELKVLTYYGSMDDRRHLRAVATDEDVDILLTTYNMVSSRAQDRKFFKRFRINYVVYDEGHLLKTCTTERYKNLMKVRGERKILLTGTPLQNNLMELISLMYFTMTKLFTKYCDNISQLLQQFHQKTHQMNDKDESMYEEDKIQQAKAILQPYILRRLKHHVLKYLPEKMDEVVKCPMIAVQREMYDELVREYREMYQNGEKASFSCRLMQLRQIANHPLLYRKHYSDNKVVQISKLLCRKESQYLRKNPDYLAEELAFLSDFAISHLCSKYSSTREFCLDEKLTLESGKFKKLDEILPSIKEKGEKVLIFSQFTTMMDVMEIYLRIRGYNYYRLDGSTPVFERQQLINDFNSSSEIFVFLLSTKAGGVGINLAAANHIILHDIDFNPYNDKQAEDRCHRMGQKKQVRVIRLISEGSVEEAMLRVARQKLRLEKDVTGDGNSAGKGESESHIIEQLLKNALSID